MKKRILSWALVLCMVLTLLPGTAFAADSMEHMSYEEYKAKMEEFNKYEAIVTQHIEEIYAEGPVYTGTDEEFAREVETLSHEISTLDRKIVALSADQSMSAVAQRKKLEAERDKLKAELDDLYSKRSRSASINALKKEIEDFYKNCFGSCSDTNYKHSMGIWVTYSKPTCMEVGEEYYCCRHCDFYVVRETPALGHDWSTWTVSRQATCAMVGEETRYCSRCGESETREIAALGHAWDAGVVTTAPTATTDGVKTFTCTRCGETKTDVIPATGIESVDPCDIFTDVTRNWAWGGIAYCYSAGLMNGVSDTEFDPDGTLTRAMLATILWRQTGEPKATQACTFPDLGSPNDPAVSWYLDAVAWAAEAGIVNGRTDGTFDPNGAITRQEMATMLYRYANAMKLDMSAKGDLSVFPDEDQVLAYAVDAMTWANGAGLINGDVIDGVTCLDPWGNATRAQVAAILMRFCENVAD